MHKFTTRPEIVGNFGVVTSTHWIASAVGMSVLEKGGNAFDAAVATGFTLQVVEPHLNGPGGEVPLILAPVNQEPIVICGQGVAPQLANLQTFNDMNLNIVPGSGLLPAVVPGAFDAWMLLLLNYGTMSLREVLEPAISIAKKGYPLVPNIVNTIKSVEQLFREEWKSSAEIYLPKGNLPQAGDFFTNNKMAETYIRIINEAEAKSNDKKEQIQSAREIWSKGFIADAIDDYCKNVEVMDTTETRHKGLLTGDDLADWSATIEKPCSYDYKNYTVCKTGPWGQGPTFLQQLALLKGFDLDLLDEKSPEFVHLVIESTKLAFADREAFYGDTNFNDVPMEILLSEKYNVERRKLISQNASMDVRPGSIPGFGGNVVVRPKGKTAESFSKFDIGEPTVARFDEPLPNSLGDTKGDTTHFDIIDKWGNMIAGTPSGGWLQSSPIIPSLGFCLSNRGQMFWLDKNSPACIGPKRRPRTTLSPTLALKDGVPYMVFGTPGGDQQDQWSLHLFLRHVHFGLNLQEAIDAPGFSTAHFPNSFYPRETDIGHLAVEGRFPKETIDALIKKGHKVSVDSDWSLGRMVAASKEKEVLKAAANPRFMQGYAIGR
ncbi:gamma-glutamyltransferase family protein [Alphaproteobacteria bacterium]|nr:gamma-glutamyltransferase family protein [Alphaproteobacteria bacterium]